MAFSLNGSHIAGGTFNNVAGSMTQVFNVVHNHAPPDVLGIDAVQSIMRTPQWRRRLRNALPFDANSAALDDQSSNGPAGIDRNPDYPMSDLPSNPSSFISADRVTTPLNIHSPGEPGIDIIYRSVVTQALHDSGERFPEPACHPGTRTAVLEELSSWSTAPPEPSNMILWLHGSAGMGKSAVAQAFAGDCQHRGQLGASFFFKRGDPRRGTWHGLFPTIAYQLATSASHLLLAVQRAVEGDRLLLGRQMFIQFQKLVLETLNIPDLPYTPVIILDGLDECDGHKIQQEILLLFIGAIRAGQLPIRLLIASRPEPHLREIMETEDILAICHTYALSADRSATEDIEIYLQDEFSRIHSEHLIRGVSLGIDWPGVDTVSWLAERASGTFIYATTVIRYIDDEYSHPADRLASVLDLDPRSTAPLDDLYTKILSMMAPTPQQLRIVHAIWKGILILELGMSPEELDRLLSLRAGTTRLAIRALHSLLEVPPLQGRFQYRKSIQPLHATLADYLADPRRSGPWCVSLSWLHEDYLASIVRSLSSPWTTIETRTFHNGIVLGLSRLLSYVTPSENVISLLRSDGFQKSVFFDTSMIWWGGGAAQYIQYPDNDSEYPQDLIQMWDDHRFISIIAGHMKLTTEQASPTCKFDSTYRDILSRHPDLLRVLRSQIVRQDSYWKVLKVIRPPSNLRLFEPFLAARKVLRIPFPPGDSPIDFLNDAHRSRDLYCDPRRIAEEQVVLWIQYTKEWIGEGKLGFSMSWMCLFDLCSSCPHILKELETLDLAQICPPIPSHGNLNRHHEVHRDAVAATASWAASDRLQHVLDWLKRFPHAPLQVISLWEKQIADLWRCSGNRSGQTWP